MAVGNGNSSERRKNQVSSLVSLFPSPALIEVLSLFVLHPDSEFYQREIAKKTGRSQLQVQRAVKRIEDAGLVIKERSGNRVYYRADTEHPALQDLARVLLKTAALGDRLRKSLQPLRDRIDVAFVFGSIAAGEETSTSDVDMLVVGEVRLRETTDALGAAETELGRELNPVVYSTDEFQRKAIEKHHFVLELIDSPKIWLVGDDDHLGELVGRGETSS
jgi:predicted nucleotidyltransferase